MKKPTSQIYTFDAQQSLYGLAWSVREDQPYRFAVGSFVEDSQNDITIIQYDGQHDDVVALPSMRIQQPFPATKVMFNPVTNVGERDLVAASSDSLRLWSLGDRPKIEKLLHDKDGEVAPLTSFDWSVHNTAHVVTSSIDPTCVVWDIESGQAAQQVQVHEQAVYDVAWGAADVFATCSADGTARVMDCRDKHTATLVYSVQQSEPKALLRIGWSVQDTRCIALLPAMSRSVVLVDLRMPMQTSLELKHPNAQINAFSMASHSSSYICTAGDDSRVLIWDLSRSGAAAGAAAGGAASGGGTGSSDGGARSGQLEAALSYEASAEVVALQWSVLSSQHILIAYGHQAQMLLV